MPWEHLCREWLTTKASEQSSGQMAYRPAVDRVCLYLGGKLALCCGLVTLWLLEVLVLSTVVVSLFSDLTHI